MTKLLLTLPPLAEDVVLDMLMAEGPGWDRSVESIDPIVADVFRARSLAAFRLLVTFS